jgi:two-component system sensor histidine kinase VanS
LKAENNLERQLTARYIMRYLVKLVIYTVIVLAVFVILYLIMNEVPWGLDSYIRTHWSNDLLLTVIAVAWAIGVFVIALMDFKKIAAQFASVGGFLTNIVDRPEAAITLPHDFLEMQTVLQKVQNDLLAGRKGEQEAVQRKNDLVMYLAHDLKTPLTSILGYLALLRDEEDVSAQNKKKYLTIVTEKAVRLENLINDFFEIARFNLNEIVLEKSRFDFARLVEQVADEFKPLLAPKGLRIEMGNADETELFADPGKLERVIDNLLRNAISYSYENSAIRMNILQDENRLILQVSNQGPQIPAHKIDRIFEQFYRVDEARSGDNGGAGLGLTIAKAIIERHNGTITAESVSELTTFTVTLPLSSMS